MEFGQTRWEGRAAEPLDLIATEVENLQIHQVLEAVDFGDSIVLQVQKYLWGGQKSSHDNKIMPDLLHWCLNCPVTFQCQVKWH